MSRSSQSPSMDVRQPCYRQRSAPMWSPLVVPATASHSPRRRICLFAPCHLPVLQSNVINNAMPPCPRSRMHPAAADNGPARAERHSPRSDRQPAYTVVPQHRLREHPIPISQATRRFPEGVSVVSLPLVDVCGPGPPAGHDLRSSRRVKHPRRTAAICGSAMNGRGQDGHVVWRTHGPVHRPDRITNIEPGRVQVQNQGSKLTSQRFPRVIQHSPQRTSCRSNRNRQIPYAKPRHHAIERLLLHRRHRSAHQRRAGQ